MSYTRQIGEMVITVVCAANPEQTYNNHYEDIKRMIEVDEYIPVTSMDNLIKNIVLMFDCDDNYGEYDEETGCGGYGEAFTMTECRNYVLDSGGYAEFDYWC